MIRLALLTTDNRDHHRRYDLEHPYFGPAPEALLEGLAETPEIETHVISCTQKQMASPAMLGGRIFFHSLLVPKWGWLRSCYLGCIRAVRSKLIELGVDLVHGQGTERDCAMEAVFSNHPNVLTIHGNIRSVAKVLQVTPLSYYWFQSFLESLVLRRTRLVFCNSDYTERMVRPLNSQTLRMPNAVRKIFYESPVLYSTGNQKRLKLLVVGLISPYKQPLEILRALRIWRQGDHPPFDCLWVGALSKSSNYQRTFALELAAAKKDGWANHQEALPAADLRRAMDQADVLLHIPKEEAFGLVVAEAMLRGMKVVAGRTGGLADFDGIYPGIQFVSPGCSG